jgi:hypothetical protein
MLIELQHIERMSHESMISTKAGNSSSTNGYGHCHVTLHGYSSAGINNVPGPSFFFKTLRQTEIINRLK